MKFLADAHISVQMVAMIRELGHDCREASTIPPRMQDIDILRMAYNEQRGIITADKDFGELVFVHRITCPAVILIRVALKNEAERVARLRIVWPTLVARLPGSFVTVTGFNVRIRPMPT